MMLLVARVARASTQINRTNYPERLAQARQDLAIAKIAKFIRETVATAPPLNRDQINALAILLRGSGDGK